MTELTTDASEPRMARMNTDGTVAAWSIAGPDMDVAVFSEPMCEAAIERSRRFLGERLGGEVLASLFKGAQIRATVSRCFDQTVLLTNGYLEFHGHACARVVRLLVPYSEIWMVHHRTDGGDIGTPSTFEEFQEYLDGDERRRRFGYCVAGCIPVRECSHYQAEQREREPRMARMSTDVEEGLGS